MHVITRQALEAARIYRSVGAISTQLLRESTYRAWERSHLQGANPRAMQVEQLSSLELERTVEKQEDLIEAVRPYAQILSQAAGKAHHAVMLSDNRAVLLNLWADDQTLQLDSFPHPGALLSEGVAGANGIGTPLAEESYAEIVGTEHFIEGFSPFTCQGIPLRNQKGEILGVFSISVRSFESSWKLKELFFCACAGIESEFILANLKADLLQVLLCNSNDYQVLEKLQQDLVQAHQSARLRMDLSSRMLLGNRIDYAKQLIQQAEQSIEIFRLRANFWRELAASETGKVKTLSIIDSIRNLIELLATEATIRKVVVVAPPLDDPINITVLENSFLRRLLRYFLRAFEEAGAGGTVQLEVKRNLKENLAQINFIIIPKLKKFSLNPNFYTLTLPLKPSP
ncbi:putative phytochrome sensor protein [Gloeothece citriformis PCC 7424]|uniref:Putative phytochrome sensor protein n=1 Tax=Gloeothece citriformis (strain PCC 7424) TaxID=65393 RepID=B7KJS2_GLOC7|nr:hypothetical protein [Gloeothece citriformis]ACK69521.1 putative phytochrome sensor protein [Gloeothece citriformis PCC 7424]